MDEAGLNHADPRVAQILGIVAKETAIDEARLTPDATIDGLGIPSLDMAQTLFALESHFDVEVPVVAERSGAEFTTVGDLVAHVLATIDAADAKKAEASQAEASQAEASQAEASRAEASGAEASGAGGAA